MSASDWGQLLLLGFLWGGSFFFARAGAVRITWNGVDPF